ncbi:hypothetical protein [Candidatus Protochlamydia sp. W-9]|uniref:hypothetical protein n=1 Tax=Candidatus Protochlamydia sp. W-9 TaxID=1785087 RepID=UPI00096A2592|nr:hypothetical protein [Candidatus Protochlamydia sp. W-9]
MEISSRLKQLDSILWGLTTLQFSAHFAQAERHYWETIEIIARGAILAFVALYCYNYFKPILPPAFNAVVHGTSCAWVASLGISLLVKQLVFVTQNKNDSIGLSPSPSQTILNKFPHVRPNPTPQIISEIDDSAETPRISRTQLVANPQKPVRRKLDFGTANGQ